MATKLIKDLQVGDKVLIKEPEAVGRISSKEKSRLFRADGGCFALDVTIETGPNKGQKICDQHHSGNTEIAIPE